MQQSLPSLFSRIFAPAAGAVPPPAGPSLFQFPGTTGQGTALVLLLERDRAGLDRFLDASARPFRRFRRMVFVTTDSDLRPFHDRGLTAELFPSFEDIAASPVRGPWLSYLARRRKILLAKWQPRWQLAYGIDWPAYLERARSLLEDRPQAAELP
ncbi:hypothetical protein [Poseidonocella sp. HB161398]|uniref:hypothetical protein n=1 Tax=Poseidonocella sp. HB161398 TaxID=2320855 RepID=UPI001108675F|nr:hypothetical protein [Poseidonocella sp. HB161398]